MRFYSARLVRCALVLAVFIGIGPMVAAMTIFAPIAVVSLKETSEVTAADASGGLLYLLTFITLWGYLIGGLSAFLAGLALAVRAYKRNSFGYGETAAVSAIAAILGSLIVLGLPNGEFGVAGGLLVWLVPLGIVSGLVCRFVLGRLRVLPLSANHDTSQPERN